MSKEEKNEQIVTLNRDFSNQMVEKSFSNISNSTNETKYNFESQSELNRNAVYADAVQTRLFWQVQIASALRTWT